MRKRRRLIWRKRSRSGRRVYVGGSKVKLMNISQNTKLIHFKTQETRSYICTVTFCSCVQIGALEIDYYNYHVQHLQSSVSFCVCLACTSLSGYRGDMGFNNSIKRISAICILRWAATPFPSFNFIIKVQHCHRQEVIIGYLLRMLYKAMTNDDNGFGALRTNGWGENYDKKYIVRPIQSTSTSINCMIVPVSYSTVKCEKVMLQGIKKACIMRCWIQFVYTLLSILCGQPRLIVLIWR